MTRVRGLLVPLLASASAGIGLALPAGAAAGGAVEHWGSFELRAAAREPTPIEGLANVTAVDASNSSAYALESGGSVWAWGSNGRGQLGDGDTRPSVQTAVHVQLPAGVTATSLGEAELAGFAIDTTGHGWTWGESGSQACMSTDQRLTKPEQVPGISGAVAVQGGGHHTIWLLSNGTVETCGANTFGQLGVPGVRSSSTPVVVPGLAEVVEISSAERTDCARTASGEVYDWGADSDGQIGNGTTAEGVFAPYRVPLPGPASEVSCGGNIPTDDFTLAIVDGQVYGWGADGSGQIGDDSTQQKDSPVATGLRFSSVVASGGTAYGLDSTGRVWSWGSGFNGALGTGRSRPQLTPEVADEGVVAISATAHDFTDLHQG